MGAFDYDGSPLGGLFSFFSGLGGGGGGSQGYAPSADTSNAPQVDQFRSDWNASQRASGLPFDDKTFTGWLQAQQQPQAAPEAQTVPLPGFLQGLLGGGNKAAAWQPYGANPLPSAQQTQASPEDQRVPLPGFLQGLLGGGGSQQATPGPQQATPDPMRDALKLPWIFRPPWSAPQGDQPGFTGGGPDAPQTAPVQQAPVAPGSQDGDYGGGSDLPAMQKAMQSSPPLLVGDSIAGHMITFGGGSGKTDRSTVGKYQDGLTAVNGFTPSQILNTVIPGIPADQIKGRNAVLSTGAANDPNDLEVIPQQIAALKARGATGVTVMGVGTAPQLKGVNDKLAKIASDAGATFAGPLAHVKSDGIHSADPKGDLAALTQAPSGGPSDNTAPMQQAMQGGTPGGRDYVDTILDTIAHHESGGRNIHQQVVGANGGYNPSTGTVTGPSSASGPWQMIDSTWRSNAQKVGVDTSKYPTAMSAPVDVQRQVARHIVENNGVGDWAPYNAPLKASLISMGVPLKGGLGGSGEPSPGSTGGGPASASGGPPGLPGSGPGAPDPDNSANSLNRIELQRIMAGLGPMPATGDPRVGLPVPGAPAVASAPAPLPGTPASLPGSTATMPGVGANGLGTGAASITPLLQQAQAAPTGPFGGFMPGLFGGNKTAMARAHEAREAQAQQQALQLNTAKFLNAAGLPLGDALARSGMSIPDAQRLSINQQSAQAAAPADNSIVPSEYRTLTSQGVPPSIAAEAARKNPTQEALKAADDAINQNKPLPPTVQKMADKQIDMLAATRQSRLTLEQLRDHLYDGSLDLGKFNQYLQKGKAAVGLSDDETVQYQKYVAAIHTLQSDELRKNSGVQTDKDAEREMDKLTGGGITSSEQAINHFNYLINQGSLAEQNLKQRHEQLYTRSKQKMPDNYWEGVETSLPGAPPTADAKTIGSDLYKDHSGKARPQPSAAPISAPAAPLSTDDQNLIGKYLTR